MTYKIVRFFLKTGRRRIIKRGLTLGQAWAHCNDPSTSSRTPASAKLRQYTRRVGPWFDGFDVDTSRAR